MTARITHIALLVSLIGISYGSAFGQYYPQQSGQQNPQAAGQQQYGPQRPSYPPAQRPMQPPAPTQGPYQGAPGQPMPPGASAIVPQNTPTLERRAPHTANAPFQLTAAEQAEVDAVLKRWGEASQKHKRITLVFYRFENGPNERAEIVQKHLDQGRADLTSSGKWLWHIQGEITDRGLVEGQREEKILCDGQSIYEFNFSGKTVTQHILAEDMRGDDMVRAMLPFLFGTDLRRLRERYFIRLLKFPNLPEGHVCIDAWPRFLEEAQNYANARMIVDMAKMEPTGLMLTIPGGKISYRYQFDQVHINPKNAIEIINDPFKFKLPSSDWKTYVEQMPAAEMSNRPVAGPPRQ
jgi:hypothetical protein